MQMPRTPYLKRAGRHRLSWHRLSGAWCWVALALIVWLGSSLVVALRKNSRLALQLEADIVAMEKQAQKQKRIEKTINTLKKAFQRLKNACKAQHARIWTLINTATESEEHTQRLQEDLAQQVRKDGD